jgi:hypothetical protein
MNTHSESPSGPYTDWYKSSFSPSQGGCVEVRFDGVLVHVRDTKDRGKGPVISAPSAAWPAFVDEVLGKAVAGSNRAVHIAHQHNGTVQLHALDYAATLTYTSDEWTAFKAGAAAGQFTLRSVA